MKKELILLMIMVIIITIPIFSGGQKEISGEVQEKKVEIKTKDGKKHIGILHKYNFKEITIIKKEKKKTCELTLKHDDILQVKVKIF